ncbi:DEAD/DEAH box helicase [Pseudomonas paraeruginosa]|uniref:DEAD/DEAH box helicase n=1 Tax=Pseudomonas aeruginosa TaxID=287 RepID=A0ABD7K082_PSEAI|nr:MULTISPECIES: DEAD/DEAH box helicase family protein [Pseudomonas aeruginosa group]KFF32152.1 DEAD/DEAH box helicase [Pseudomonas aeruginosa VRFPA01]KFF32999.1 DEAD/DEAH box helicase [Pseudomonas aeruginosa VRFPA01]MBG7302629.1 DEAD/DEAH box helicase family protein [Pseudomonas aeruginosa]RTR95928.1 DEAD/DEAH box helicase [Pseudomonas paraeruginosa]RTS44231.1 DEAD/DEAH box helicase [Pseudomonas aeruginosa]
MTNPFQDREPHIENNERIRTPQKGVFLALNEVFGAGGEEREFAVILPVGCGKSGSITISPFAFRSRRTLVVAPGVAIAQQLASDFDPSNPNMFYQKCAVLVGAPYPEPVEIRGMTTNRADLDEAHVVITNIQQLQGGDSNRWLRQLPADYFDLILVDEGHHGVAESWQALKAQFPEAQIVNFSATPMRADGQLMEGRVIYTYPIFEAIREGYVKRLKAVQLNPRTLRYVRREDGQEIEVGLAEVRRLGEEDADFRRSIVTSTETLNTIVDASIRELRRLREETGEVRLKIIASALNYAHCRQVVEAYVARGLRASYVHSRENAPANQRVMQRLESHELDVIVQVRKLGEGFDHPYLSVAAVFSIFSNLSPFVQFVGRIMRVIRQNAPGDVLNQGVVVFHAGANIARRWADFQEFSEADRDYFDQLLPVEEVDPDHAPVERQVEPIPHDLDGVEVRSQSDVHVEEIPLLLDDEALAALRVLQERGYTANDVAAAYQTLQPLPTTRVRERQAMRDGLPIRVRTAAGRILGERDINPNGRELDMRRLGRTNLIVMIAAINSQVNTFVGMGTGQRHEFSREMHERIDQGFDGILAAAVREVFGGN